MRKIRTYHEVETDAGASLVEQVAAQQRRLARRLASVDAVVAIASGKGGVGKSLVTANLAAALAGRGLAVGAADADLNGPSLARMLGARPDTMSEGDDGVVPARGVRDIRVISTELLQDAAEAPLRWRGPDGHEFLWQSSLETGVLREFLSDVAWGRLDVLLVDVPPGTDKISRLLALLPTLPCVLVVTTPSEMARAVVARSVAQVRDAGVPTIGLVANMTSWVCPDCGTRTPLYDADGARRLASDTGLELWAELPFDPRMARHTDRGEPLVLSERDAPVSRAVEALASRLVEALRGGAS